MKKKMEKERNIELNMHEAETGESLKSPVKGKSDWLCDPLEQVTLPL